MAIDWGGWQSTSGLGSGNQMRVGIEVSRTSVDHDSNSVRFTFRVWTANRYSIDYAGMRLNFGGDWGSGSATFNNRQGSDSQTLRATRTWTYSYGNSYGSSPGTRTFVADVAGPGAGSKSVTVTIPARPIARPNPPTNASASRSGASAANLSWTNHSTAGRPYETMRIDRQANNSDWLNAWSGTPRTSGQITDLGANQRHRFRVRANNAANSSDWDTTGWVFTEPAVPGSVKAVLQADGRIRVTWTDDTGYDCTFRVDRNVDGSGWVTRATGLTGTAWTDTNPPAGSVRYRIRAVAEDASITSDWAIPGAVSTLPAPPTGVQATARPDDTILVAWTNRVAYTAYTVSVQRSTGGEWATVATLASGQDTWTDPNPGTGRNTYRVQAAGIGSSTSGWVESNSVSIAAGAVPSPDAPADLTPDDQVLDCLQPVTLTWTHDPGAPAQTAYRLRHQTGGGPWTTITVTAPQSQHVLAAGSLADAATLTWQVQTQGDPAGGYGPWSAVAQILGARCKVRIDGQWVPRPMTVWDGTQWVPRPVLVRVDGQWV